MTVGIKTAVGFEQVPPSQVSVLLMTPGLDGCGFEHAELFDNMRYVCLTHDLLEGPRALLLLLAGLEAASETDPR